MHARGTGWGLRTSSPCPCVCTYVRTRTRAFGVHIRTPTQRVPTPDICWFVSRDSLRPLRTRYPSTLCMYVIAKCPPRCCTMLCIGRTPHRRRQRCSLSAFRCSLFAARAYVCLAAARLCVRMSDRQYVNTASPQLPSAMPRRCSELRMYVRTSAQAIRAESGSSRNTRIGLEAR